jgi:hypothetical protein
MVSIRATPANSPLSRSATRPTRRRSGSTSPGEATKSRAVRTKCPSTGLNVVTLFLPEPIKIPQLRVQPGANAQWA